MSIAVIKEKRVLVIESSFKPFVYLCGDVLIGSEMRKIAGWSGVSVVAVVVFLAVAMAGYRSASKIHVGEPVEASSLPLKSDYFISIPASPLFFEEVPLFSFSGPAPTFLRHHFGLTPLVSSKRHSNILRPYSWLYSQNRFALWLHVPVFIWVRSLLN